MFFMVVAKPARLHVASYVSWFPIDSGFVCDNPVNSRIRVCQFFGLGSSIHLGYRRKELPC